MIRLRALADFVRHLSKKYRTSGCDCLRLLSSSKFKAPAVCFMFGPLIRRAGTYYALGRLPPTLPNASQRLQHKADRRISPVMRSRLHPYARRIYVHAFRTGIGFFLISATSPGMTASRAISVRQAGALPVASLGFHLEEDTLAVRLTAPPLGLVENSQHQARAPCRAHKQEKPPPPGDGPLLSCVGYS